MLVCFTTCNIASEGRWLKLNVAVVQHRTFQLFWNNIFSFFVGFWELLLLLLFLLPLIINGVLCSLSRGIGEKSRVKFSPSFLRLLLALAIFVGFHIVCYHFVPFIFFLKLSVSLLPFFSF